ncbi:hypothetical protein GF402_07190 [Candidatus Fermentibacteria bacterium]|nr:hypothetical protein [Candidatus Fermentibacteria bacterium]
MRIVAAILAALAVSVLLGCGEEPQPQPHPDHTTPDTVIAEPMSPLQVALEFSERLLMNDPSCMDLLSPGFRRQICSKDSTPRQIFGRWRGFDADGRLTEIREDSAGRSRTSYYCFVSRMERPAIVRIDFLLLEGGWSIDGLVEELPQQIVDSLTVDRLAGVILQNPAVRRELRMARVLMDDCRVDSVLHYASWNAAALEDDSFSAYVSELTPESYGRLARSNIRRAGKYQIIQERATYNLSNVPARLNSFVASWREMAYLSKAVLRARHEAMQDLRQTGEWIEPEAEEELGRLSVQRDYFMSVSNLVESRDTLSRVYPVILTVGTEEPLQHVAVELDPHVLEQRSETDVGVPVWRALGVEMNGDRDPERVVYWSGDLYLFEGRPNGYRLMWRTYEGYNSDYHAEFSSEPGDAPGFRKIALVGNDNRFEYTLSYRDGTPVFSRVQLGSEEDSTQTVE